MTFLSSARNNEVLLSPSAMKVCWQASWAPKSRTAAMYIWMDQVLKAVRAGSLVKIRIKTEGANMLTAHMAVE